MNRYSVIIPVFNDQHLLADAVESAWQAGADEVVVVDGNSDDQSTGVANQLDCRLLHSQRGRGYQLDCGARAASGDVLIFLHADAALTGDCLIQVGDAIQRDAAVWGCFQQSIDGRGQRFRWLERGNAWRARVRRLVYGDQGIWMTRQAYDDSGGFPQQPLMEDVVLSDRLRAIGPPHILPGPIQVSARGWLRRGVFRQTIRNWTLFGLYRCGVSAERIARWYQ